ncbi:hypothetical protein ACVW0J_005029 [Bradyrhizobium sp. i1.7.7]
MEDGAQPFTSDARYLKMSGITFVVYNPPQLGLPYLAVMIAPNSEVVGLPRSLGPAPLQIRHPKFRRFRLLK